MRSLILPAIGLAALLIGLSAGPGWAAEAWLPHNAALADRITWGQTPDTVRDIKRLGEDRWLDQQLHPDPDARLPPAVQARLDSLPIAQKPMMEWVAETDTLKKSVKGVPQGPERLALRAQYRRQMNSLSDQSAERFILRALYSPNQLQEKMTWFWLNHFSVYANKSNIRAMVGDYQDEAIRPRALGRFRDLLEASLKHPAMLQFLDNNSNAVGHINENYAREIMELHTMGVGSGYTQRDVEELARILTGVGVETRRTPPDPKGPHAGDLVQAGLFRFNPDRHDYGDKVFLGHNIKGSGFAEVEEALDILSAQPATAQYVSKRLAIYFVGDNPSPALVDQMAKRFSQTDGDIPSVLKTLFASAEFKASLGQKVKSPSQYVISAVRFSYGDQTAVNSAPILKWLDLMGAGLYDRHTPDGYPLDSLSWSGPGQIGVRFAVARQIGSNPPALTAGGDPADAPPAPDLRLKLTNEGLDRSLGAKSRQTLSQATSTQEWNALFLSSPEFMRN